MADDPRIPQKRSKTPAGKNENAKINYTATGYGNEHGGMYFGKIDRNAQVTAGVQLQGKDGRHQLTLDNDGLRRGCTTSTSPGKFSVRTGTDTSGKIISPAEDTCSIIADNGNITIVASNGKIRLQATDIEMIAIGDKGSNGNIIMDATESVSIKSKKFLVSSSFLYRISSVGYGEISTCGPLTIYGAAIKGFTAATFYKDSKVGGQLVQRLNNILTAINIFRD
jgi:hypothetical protein